MLAARTGKFRHVVFADALNGAARAINYTPTASAAIDGPLHGEESEFVQALFRRVGLCADHYRSESLHRRLPACLRALGATSLAGARVILNRYPPTAHVAVGAMLIGVTSFFRDSAVFQALHESVLPGLCARQPAPRIWSIGCSDGAELYSVAMLLREIGRLESSYLLGTDVRPDAILRALIGSYDAEPVKAVPAHFRRQYFRLDRLSGRYQLTPELVKRVHWRTADMLKSIEPGPWDVILCRNVAMYLRTQALTALWSQLAEALAPRGILVLGKAERPSDARHLRSIATCIYQRDR